MRNFDIPMTIKGVHENEYNEITNQIKAFVKSKGYCVEFGVGQPSEQEEPKDIEEFLQEVVE